MIKQKGLDPEASTSHFAGTDHPQIHRPLPIKKILAYLGLSEEAKLKPERAPPFPEMVETIIEPYDDGWPNYEELFIEVQTL